MLNSTFADIDYFAWDEPGITRDIVYMFGVGTTFFIILLMIEYRIVAAIIYFLRTCCQRKQPIDLNDTGRIDSDVQDEKTKVAEMTKTDIECHNLVLKDMSKLYGEFLAVNQMSVKVDQ